MFKRLKSKRAVTIFSFLVGLSATTLIQLGVGAGMITVSQLPISKDFHRTRKANVLCQGEELGYKDYEGLYRDLELRNGKTIKVYVEGSYGTLPDVVNADPMGYMKNVPQDVKDRCEVLVSQLSKKQVMTYIKD